MAMSPVGRAHSLVIETRRTVRAKAGSLQKPKPVNGLSGQRDPDHRDADGSWNGKRPLPLSRPDAERDVPFRYSAGAPRLVAPFAAQILGQALPQKGRQPSRVLAAYKPGSLPALLCDRRL